MNVWESLFMAVCALWGGTWFVCALSLLPWAIPFGFGDLSTGWRIAWGIYMYVPVLVCLWHEIEGTDRMRKGR